MLLQLNIKNFALIENMTISFGRGFNVLSGETGAGKSILIDAINYIIGNKFNKELIRTGKNKTFVEAVFTLENSKTSMELKSMGINYEEGILIISRETFQSGRSIAKVNGKSVLLSDLKKVTSTILDIHGQHQNQNLLLPENHIDYLDDYGENSILDLLKKYCSEYMKFDSIRLKIQELSDDHGDIKKVSAFLKYQLDEINSSNLSEEEESELNKKFKILSHSEKISNILNKAYQGIDSSFDDKKSIQDELGYITRSIESIEDVSQNIKDINRLLKDAYYNIGEAAEEIRALIGNVNYDTKELERINNRIYEISGYKKKYGNTIKEILEYRDKIKKRYENIINREYIIEKLKKDKLKIESNLKKISNEIHKARTDVAEELEMRVKKELNFIGMERSTFKIKVELKDRFTKKGMDFVQFYMSTNPGEPLRPLEKIVSGGELSRIMLALKTVFVDKDKIPSVIFDEIDTGISGRVAQCVAEKMYAISKKRQVLCVTHLPQIASMSDNHYLVEKEVQEGKTYTKIRKLSHEEKECEISKMVGSSKVTEITMAHARELIKMADSKKNSINN